MIRVAFVWNNLWRNRLRSGLTIASVAASLCLLTLLLAVVDAMRDVAAESAAQLRLVVRERASMTNLVPIGHAARMRELPGVAAICAVRWFGGRVEGSAAQFPSLAAEPSTFAAVYPDFELSAEELSGWSRSRRSAIVGRELAARMGWTPGTRVTLRGGIPPYPRMEFEVVAVTRARAYPSLFVLRLDYLRDVLAADRTLPEFYPDSVNFFWVKAESPDALERLRCEVDRLFEQSPVPTRSELEEAFIAEFTRMFGDVPGTALLAGLATIASIILVLCNTAAIAFRERVGELAVLRAIGFSGPRVAGALLAEAALLGFLGGVVGAAGATGFTALAAGGILNAPYAPIIVAGPHAVVLGVAVGLAVGLVGGLPAARRAVRLPVAPTLREAG